MGSIGDFKSGKAVYDISYSALTGLTKQREERPEKLLQNKFQSLLTTLLHVSLSDKHRSLNWRRYLVISTQDICVKIVFSHEVLSVFCWLEVCGWHCGLSSSTGLCFYRPENFVTAMKPLDFRAEQKQFWNPTSFNYNGKRSATYLICSAFCSADSLSVFRSHTSKCFSPVTHWHTNWWDTTWWFVVLFPRQFYWQSSMSMWETCKQTLQAM